jgi:tRNA(fMet)-specific endonuclease VapC
MADNIILVDTSILIDYFRKPDKTKSKLISLIRTGYRFQISSITEYEIFAGSTPTQQGFWEELLKKTEVLSFNKGTAQIAVQLNSDLKVKRQQIAIADLFIAAIAIENNIAFATLNLKHFDRIAQLKIVT